MQEGAGKDVECTFVVLQSRFDIVCQPARLWKKGDIINIMRAACVILHNMIVEDEKESIREILDLKGNPSAIII
jgi:hypothetical protein